MSGLRTVGRLLVGRALSRQEASSEQITPVEGLSALSLDALTSVAYGPEAILIVLASAGATSLHLILPITIAIVVLLVILVTSYRQVIDAYPHGGGAYAVSRDNFGPLVSKLAGAALIVDYTLTVAVSIAAGVGALTSAFPSTTPYTVEMCLGILLIITTLNLRGLGESARAFLVPTLVFIVGLLAIIGVGLIHPLGLGRPPVGRSLVPTHALETVSAFLVLKAFSAGCSALTGVEAIANGVPLFKEPRVTRAKRTELLLGAILGLMLLGLAVLAGKFHVQPRTGQTALSQIMAEAVGRHWAYYIVSLTITLVLALAANTSFGGLPVLTSLLSRDNYLPHLFGVRDSRLVFGNGVWTLALFSGVLLVAVGGDTNTLIPLFAIGVFIGFTLSQAGLVVHWRRTRERAWTRRATINGIGAAVTASATVVFLLTKFVEGAWVVVIAIPLFIILFNRVEVYYRRAGVELGIGVTPPRPDRRRTVVVVPVTNVSRLTEHALSEALSLGDEVVAVTVVFDGELVGLPQADVERQWRQWNPGVELRVLHTDYASIVQPIVRLVDDLRADGDRQVVVLIPVVIPDRLRYRLLHNQVDLALAGELRRRPDVVVARVPMPIHPSEPPGHDGSDDDHSVGRTGDGKRSPPTESR
ncbi:MAG TPA: APC family permease [Acidimicrobiales bacterium]|nr:APC family permease [Acidimicrobiales bacterium]